MKKLTIQQKAERYDEVLKRAKLEKEKSKNLGLLTFIDENFPELEESEDYEKIKKKIIQALRGDVLDMEETTKAIAWLEKQETSYTKKDVDDAYLKGVTDTKNEIEKQYEANYQIRKDIATFIFNYRGDIKDRAKWMNYLGIKVSIVEKQGELIGDTDTVDSNEDGLIAETMKYKREQKSAWSEEDEKMLDTVIEDIVKLAGPYICYHTDVEWLKSLKGRVQPQPKQEWSEEDINMLQSILDEYKSMPTEKRNWLKSLKQRIGG